MGWDYVGGQLAVQWFPSALVLTAAIIGSLLVMRRLSLNVLENAPQFGDRHRYVRGARWGWLVATASFVAVIVGVSALLDYTAWDFRATALAWLMALMPVAGSIGFVMLQEFMGFWLWAQAAWDEMGGGRLDWTQYRGVASRLESDRTRWTYYAAWVVGSIGLTAGPLWTYATVNAG